MVCPKCNAEMYSNGICSKCGTRLGVIPQNVDVNIIEDRLVSCKENMEYNLKNGRKREINSKSLINFAIVFASAVLISVILVIPFKSYANKTMLAIRQGEEQKALNYYSSYIEGEESESNKLDNMLIDYLDELVDAYNKGDANPEKVLEKINFIDEELAFSSAKLYKNKVEKLKESKDAYLQGRKNYEARKYVETIDRCKEVIVEDVSYIDAQICIRKAQTEVSNSYVIKMNKAIKENDLENVYAVLIEVNEAEKSDMVIAEEDVFSSTYVELYSTYIDLLKKKIESLKKEGAYENIYSLSTDALKCIGDGKDSSEMKQYKEDACKALSALASSKAENYMDDGNYYEAYRILYNNLKYDTDGSIQNMIDRLVSKLQKEI